MFAQEELVEHEPEIRIPCTGIHQNRLRMPLEHVAQRRLEQLYQVVHLLELAQAIRVQRPVAADEMQFLQQSDRLPGQQLAPHLFAFRLTHRSRHVPQHVVEEGAMLFAVCAPGLEPVLASEMRALGPPGRTLAGGVETEGDLREAMRLNLWLRTASRVLLRIGEPFRATTFAELVRKASAMPWERFLRKEAHVAFRVTCHKSRLYHSGAVAERLHTALESRTRFPVPLADGSGEEVPADSQLFLARFEHDVCTVSVDSSGALLHRRGWRGPQAKAPLRETLAAALLLGAGFTGEEPLCDPLCGSGTIAIAAALIAMRRAPGIARAFAFQRWPEFSGRQWEHLTVQARKQERPLAIPIEASDQDAGAVAATAENASRAGAQIVVLQRRLAELPPNEDGGLLACNPPYGVRIAADVQQIFGELKEAMKRRPRWRMAIIALQGAAMTYELQLKSFLRTRNAGISVEALVSSRLSWDGSLRHLHTAHEPGENGG